MPYQYSKVPKFCDQYTIRLICINSFILWVTKFCFRASLDSENFCMVDANEFEKKTTNCMKTTICYTAEIDCIPVSGKMAPEKHL